MQPARAHRLDLGGVRLHLVEDDAFADAFAQVIGKRLEDVLVHRGVFDRRIGEDQRRRALELLRVLRWIGDEVAVLVTVKRVQLAAMAARVLG